MERKGAASAPRRHPTDLAGISRSGDGESDLGHRGSGLEGGKSGNDIRGLCTGRGGPRRAERRGRGPGREDLDGGCGPGARPGPLPGGVSCRVGPPALPAPLSGPLLVWSGRRALPAPLSSPCSASLPSQDRGGSGPGRRVRGPGFPGGHGDAARTLRPAVRSGEPHAGRARGDALRPAWRRRTRAPTPSSPAWPWRPPARLPRSRSRSRLRLFTPRRRSSPRWWPRSPK